jgi:hypothetical protein
MPPGPDSSHLARPGPAQSGLAQHGTARPTVSPARNPPSACWPPHRQAMGKGGGHHRACPTPTASRARPIEPRARNRLKRAWALAAAETACARGGSTPGSCRRPDPAVKRSWREGRIQLITDCCRRPNPAVTRTYSLLPQAEPCRPTARVTRMPPARPRAHATRTPFGPGGFGPGGFGPGGFGPGGFGPGGAGRGSGQDPAVQEARPASQAGPVLPGCLH